VRDMQHLQDMARPVQSAASQSGSARQVNKITPRGVWDEYVSAISEEPLDPSSSTNSLLVNLQDVISQDNTEAFGNGMVAPITQLTDWSYKRFDKRITIFT
jgi:hypothetical protein